MSKGRAARRKGHQFERDIANVFKKYFSSARRAVEDSVVNEGIDIANTEPFAIQCKRYAKAVPMSCLDEVVAKPGRIPLLISRTDPAPFQKGHTNVTMRLEDFLAILGTSDFIPRMKVVDA